jgi:hypothetical protein
MYVVTWEPKRGAGGGHQVAMTLDRAETVHRAVSRALPGADVRIEPVDGYVPPGEEPPACAEAGSGPGKPSRERRRAGSGRCRGMRVKRL